MRPHTLRYAISDLSHGAQAYTFDEGQSRRSRWQADVARWAFNGVDFIQLREKSLEVRELLSLAQEATTLLHSLDKESAGTPRPKLLVNGRPDIAAAGGADGVHLPAQPGELLPAQVRELFRAAGLPSCFVSVSCHSEEEVVAARDRGADLILVGPVFGKSVAGQAVAPGIGLARLAEACALAGTVPVLALGGVTPERVPSCLAIGARGVAGIRLFAAGAPDKVQRVKS